MKHFDFQRDVKNGNLLSGEVYNKGGVNLFYACGYCVGYFRGMQKFSTLGEAKQFIKTLFA